jgi:proteasome lid subunit RPN8/RPN11
MIFLSRETETAIRSEGEKYYPNECCGVLLGVLQDDDRVVEQILPVENHFEQDEQFHRFKIESEDIMRAEIRARKEHLDVLGFYHSHPDHPAAPSDYDREYALPFYSYIITRVHNGKAAEMTSWTLAGDRSVFNPEIIAPSPAAT